MDVIFLVTLWAGAYRVSKLWCYAILTDCLADEHQLLGVDKWKAFFIMCFILRLTVHCVAFCLDYGALRTLSDFSMSAFSALMAVFSPIVLPRHKKTFLCPSSLVFDQKIGPFCCSLSPQKSWRLVFQKKKDFNVLCGLRQFYCQLHSSKKQVLPVLTRAIVLQRCSCCAIRAIRFCSTAFGIWKLQETTSLSRLKAFWTNLISVFALTILSTVKYELSK